MTSDERFQQLIDWVQSNGGQIHPSVEVFNDSITGISLRVRQDATAHVQPWEAIISLPTTLTLSYLNAIDLSSSSSSYQSNSYHQRVLSQTPPHVLSRYVLAQEYHQGNQSFWYPYIRLLPQPQKREEWAIPPFWGQDDRELLDGTNAGVSLEEIRMRAKEEFAALDDLYAKSGQSKSEVTTAESGDESRADTPGIESDNWLARPDARRLWEWACSIFSSCSFRPSLVLPESTKDVLPDGVRMDDFSVLLPLFDIGNHDMTVDVRWDIATAVAQSNNSSSSSSSSMEDGNQQRVPAACTLKVGRTYHPGQQIFNNYGMKTNAELLVGYNFLIPPTDELHNDYVHLRRRTTSSTPPLSSSQQAATAAPSADEFLLSLRTITDPSSLLIRNRMGILSPSLPPVGPPLIARCFQHLQLSMPIDIFTALAGTGAVGGGGGGEEEEDKEVSAQPHTNDPAPIVSSLRHLFLSGRIPLHHPFHPASQQTLAVIDAKVAAEQQKLNETDVEIASPDDGSDDGGDVVAVVDKEASLSKNQRLALLYRKQVRAVLDAVVDALYADEEQE